MEKLKKEMRGRGTRGQSDDDGERGLDLFKWGFTCVHEVSDCNARDSQSTVARDNHGCGDALKLYILFLHSTFSIHGLHLNTPDNPLLHCYQLYVMVFSIPLLINP